MKKKNWNQIKYVIGAILLLGGILALAEPVKLQAAEQPVTVTYCKLNSKGKKLTVKAKVKNKTKAMGSKLYLLNLNANVSETGKKSTVPLASVKAKKGTVSFKVDYKDSMLFQKFAVAYKSGKKYKIVSDVRYITNPEALAVFTGKGPTASSKKGLQVENLSDSIELGTQHAVVNWTLNSILNTNAIHKTTFTYKNKTYYLDEDQLQKNDELVKAYKAAGVRVTVILLLPKDADSIGTVSMQFGGYNYTQYSSFKTSSKAGCQTLEAVMLYLAKRYGTKENLVSGWIVGNEINSPVVWNYGGNKSLSSYMENYARAFRICSNAVKSVSKNAKVYISLDYNWNNDVDGKGKHYFSSKSVLDTFYTKLKEKGAIDFQIAYHAYPEGLSDPVFWNDARATNSVNSKIVNFKNLTVLTKYVKKQFGSSCKIMLSEQSFNSTRGEEVQAAAYAYAYYLCVGISMIEAFIYGRHVDNAAETKSGYYWGLYDTWYVKRLAWHVFQYIDSKESLTFTNPLLPYTNIKNWNKVSGFKKTKYTQMASKLNKAVITGIVPASSTSLTLTWNKLNTADGYEIYRNGALLTTLTDNSIVTYTDKNLTKGGTYQYQIRMYKEAPQSDNAKKKVKLYGATSDVVSATAAPAQVTLNETGCSVSGKDVTVAWKKMTDVDGFEIYRAEAADGSYTLVGPAAGSQTSYKDQTAQSGMTYYYKVRAYVTVSGVNYYGSYSNATAQSTVICLTAKVENGKVVLNWTQCAGAVSYRVFCKQQTDTDFVRILGGIRELTYDLTQYKDAAGNLIDFKVGGVYDIRVRGVYADGTTSKYSNIVEVTIDESFQNTGTESTETESTETESTETESTETETETEEYEPGMTDQAP